MHSKGNNNDDASSSAGTSRSGKTAKIAITMKTKPKRNSLRRQALTHASPDFHAPLLQRPMRGVMRYRYVGARPTRHFSNHPCNVTMCELCASLEKDPTLGLPQTHSIYRCSDCQSYSDDRRTWIQAERESKELLDYLLKTLSLSSHKIIKEKLEVKGASFLNGKPNCQDMEIRLALQKKGHVGPQEELFHTMEIRVKHPTCTVCLRKDPTPGSWSTVVQLKQYGSHKQSRLNLERAILNHLTAASLIARFKRVGHDTYFFFCRETDAIRFCSFLSAVAPVKLDEIQKINASSSESCITAWVCPICLDDLVYLPPEVSASLGNLGPLVICRRLNSNITLKDPFNSRKCTMSAADYWKVPFVPLMSITDLAEFVVLDVENVPRGMRDSLVHVQAARASDDGKNDKTFAVRSHLVQDLKQGDFVFCYDLCRSSINNMEVGIFKDPQQLDLVLVMKKDDWVIQCTQAAMEERSPEYDEFLKDLEKNRDGMFNLSLHSGESEMMRIED